MKLDVLLVDDENSWLEVMSYIVDSEVFNSIEFSDFNKALNYVEKKVGSIYACFVDMKPLNNFGNSPEDYQKTILELPEKIFYSSRNKIFKNNFYFISSHKSDHDKEVLKKTNANFINKSDLFENMSGVLSKIQADSAR